MVRLGRSLHETYKFLQLFGVQIGYRQVRHARLCPGEQMIALGRHRVVHHRGIVSCRPDKQINDMFPTFVYHCGHRSFVQIVQPSPN